jgi:hypothetical protein
MLLPPYVSSYLKCYLIYFISQILDHAVLRNTCVLHVYCMCTACVLGKNDLVGTLFTPKWGSDLQNALSFHLVWVSHGEIS